MTSFPGVTALVLVCQRLQGTSAEIDTTCQMTADEAEDAACRSSEVAKLARGGVGSGSEGIRLRETEP